MLFVSIWKTSEAISINCTFEQVNYGGSIGSVYRCIATTLFDGRDSDMLTVVYGFHLNGNANVNVQALVINSQNLAFVPRNIEAFFPNLRVLNLALNSISNIKNEHLIPFPNLIQLELGVNRITTLDSNLFSGMTLLRQMDFRYNNIMHVGHAINLLNDAINLDFRHNPCIDLLANTIDAIANLRFELMANCPATMSQIETDLASRPNLLTNLNSQVQSVVKRTESLEQSHNEMKNEQKSLSNLLTNLINRQLQLERRVTFLESLGGQSNPDSDKEINNVNKK